jgi:hypothetical protein
MFGWHDSDSQAFLELLETVGKSVRRRVFDCAKCVALDDSMLQRVTRRQQLNMIDIDVKYLCVPVPCWGAMGKAPNSDGKLVLPNKKWSACGRLAQYGRDWT